jgi:hypothetical protein
MRHELRAVTQRATAALVLLEQSPGSAEEEETALATMQTMVAAVLTAGEGAEPHGALVSKVRSYGGDQ